MKFDVSLAGWILAVVSFFIGTIVPVVYGKFTFEGISIKQPYELRVFRQNDDQKENNEMIFSTLLKFANATSSSILVDEIKLNPSVIHGIQFYIQNVSFKSFTPEGQYSFHVPLSDEKDVALNYLPFIVKSNEEKSMVMEFKIKATTEKRNIAFNELSKYGEKNGLLVGFRINGKYRSYTLYTKND